MTGVGRRFALVLAWVCAGRSAHCAIAVLMILASGARMARADSTWDPVGERMAWTDRSVATGIQPRIWLLTNGGASGYPGRLLVTRNPDFNQNGWLYTR